MAAIQPPPVIDEILEFLTSAPTPEEIIAFRPSEIMQTRVGYPLDGNRNRTLSQEERIELDEYTQLEHFMRLLKIKARQKLV